jgi:hypothetical protein
MVTAEGPDDEIRGELWVPLPSWDGKFFARLMLINDRDTELDTLDTESFQEVHPGTGARLEELSGNRSVRPT